ncbi:MAG: RimK/LysX family protein [Acidimicrobiia bacterium]
MAPSKLPGKVIGWREFIDLPDLCPVPIKAKIDTGARTSALHAFGLRVKEVEGIPVARFEIHPVQRSSQRAVRVAVPVHRWRRVKSSNGVTERRPSIITRAHVGSTAWDIELTLTSRDTMGFRMLLGRSAIRGRFLVHPSRSFILSERPQQVKRGSQ